MVALTATQEYNLRAALATAKTEPEALRLAFAIWSESRALVYANGGLNTSKSQGVTPQIAEILRRSLAIKHDAIGNNGRSTGMLQQISKDVGGAWGDLAGTMDPAESARRFLAVLNVTSVSQYQGTLQTSAGSRRVVVQLSDPIAADVLRVQQPLADEAESSNYNANQVAIARQIVAQLWAPTNAPRPAATEPEDWLDMSTKEELTELIEDAAAASNATLVIIDNDSGWAYSIAPRHFQAVNDKVLSHGKGTGFLRVSPQKLNWVQLIECRDWAFNGKGNEAAKAGEAAAIWHDGGQFS